MSRSPLYALLCFQLAFAPAALAATPPTWEGKRAEMAKEIKEAIEQLDKLDKYGAPCSDNYVKSQCPKTMPQSPKQSFVEAARKNLKDMEKEVAALAPEAKIADQPFDEKLAAKVDGCSGAGGATAADATKRKAAVDKMSAVFNKVNSAVTSDLDKLFDSGAKFVSLRNACASEISSFSFLARSVMPASPHQALQNLWSRDNSHPQCPAQAKDEFLKLTGSAENDKKSMLGGIAFNSKEYAANLAKSSASLAQHSKAATQKVDCKTLEGTQTAGKPADEKKPGVSGKPEEKPGTVADADPAKTPGKDKPATQPQAEPAKTPVEKKPDPAPAETAAKPTGEKPSRSAPANEPLASAQTPNDPIVPEQKPLTPSNPTGEESAGLSKGHVVAGLAILGVGAGAAYLIFSKKDKGSSGEAYTPVATGTATATATQTSSQTATGTSSGTETKTSTSTSTGPISTNPYTGTLTATSVETGTATSSTTGTQTNTSSGTSTSTRQ